MAKIDQIFKKENNKKEKRESRSRKLNDNDCIVYAKRQMGRVAIMINAQRRRQIQQKLNLKDDKDNNREMQELIRW